MLRLLRIELIIHTLIISLKPYFTLLVLCKILITSGWSIITKDEHTHKIVVLRQFICMIKRL